VSDFDDDRSVDDSLDEPVPSTDPEAPKEDAVDQATEVVRVQRLESTVADPEASEADVLDQHRVVGDDEEIERGD
jgi:hypothetical protein